MSRIFEEMCNQAKKEGLTDTAKRMLVCGYALEEIAKVTALPLDEVKKLQAE